MNIDSNKNINKLENNVKTKDMEIDNLKREMEYTRKQHERQIGMMNKFISHGAKQMDRLYDIVEKAVPDITPSIILTNAITKHYSREYYNAGKEGAVIFFNNMIIYYNQMGESNEEKEKYRKAIFEIQYYDNSALNDLTAKLLENKKMEFTN